MIGVDVVSISRLQTMLARSPGLEARLCSEDERSYCHSRPNPARHIAGTVAAKEAVIKAAGLGQLVAWARRIEVNRDDVGAPTVAIDGSRAPLAVSISHDGDTAVAVAIMLPPEESLLEMNRVAAELAAQG